MIAQHKLDKDNGEKLATNMDIDVSEAQNKTTSDSVSLVDPGLDYQFNVLLVNIKHEITDDDLTAMKYLLRGEQGTGRRVLERITTAFKLFDHLQGRRLLSRDNILFLQAMLFHARRMDLFNQLIDFAKDRENTLHCYRIPDNPVSGYKNVKFHVEGTLHRHDLEAIRSMASQYLYVPAHLVTVQGIEATESFLITFMVPEECYKLLCNIGEAEKQTLKSIGVDYIVVGEQKMELTVTAGDNVSTKENCSIQTGGLQLKDELNYYRKQNAALERQLEQHQLRELRTCKPDTESIPIMSSLTIIATLLFNILQAGKNSLPKRNTTDSAYSYFRHMMNKINARGYDKDLIGSLLEAHSLVVRQNHIEERRLLMEQHKWHIQFLEHMNRTALYTHDKLKYLLGKELKEPVLSENEEYFLHYVINDIQKRINIRHIEIIGEEIDPTQLRPYLEELSKHLHESDKQKLRHAFGIKSVEENIMQTQKLCFIEILMTIESQRCDGYLNIESFGNKLVLVIDRKDFEEQWQSQMEKFALKHQEQQNKTGTQAPCTKPRRQSEHEPAKVVKSDEVAKMEEMSDKLEIIMKKMANIENHLVQNPFARLDMTQLESYATDIDEMPEQFKGTL